MTKSFEPALANKYEEEIDRSKILIQKSVISALAQNMQTTIRPIEMHYTLQIAIELERIVDYIILLNNSDKDYLEEIHGLIEVIKTRLEQIDQLDYLTAAALVNKVNSLTEFKIVNVKNSNKSRIKRHFQNLSEIMMDWAITKKIED